MSTTIFSVWDTGILFLLREDAVLPHPFSGCGSLRSDFLLFRVTVPQELR